MGLSAGPRSSDRWPRRSLCRVAAGTERGIRTHATLAPTTVLETVEPLGPANSEWLTGSLLIIFSSGPAFSRASSRKSVCQLHQEMAVSSGVSSERPASCPGIFSMWTNQKAPCSAFN